MPQLVAAAESSWQVTVTEVPVVNSNSAVRLVDGFGGAGAIATAGIVVSTVHMYGTAVVLPAPSVPVSVNVCDPSASAVYETGLWHGVIAGCESSCSSPSSSHRS